MKKIIIGFILGLSLGLAITAYAKYESRSIDAASVAGYGWTGTVIALLKVNTDGTLQIQ